MFNLPNYPNTTKVIHLMEEAYAVPLDTIVGSTDFHVELEKLATMALETPVRPILQYDEDEYSFEGAQTVAQCLASGEEQEMVDLLNAAPKFQPLYSYMVDVFNGGAQ